MPAISRRTFLRTSLYSLTGVAAIGAAGCSPLIDHIAQPKLPGTLSLPSGSKRNPTAHLLSRAGFGPRPEQISQVEKIGRVQWIDQQLAYEQIADESVALHLRRFDTLSLMAADMHSFGWDKSFIAGELSVMTLLRAVYSERQLFEAMVGFWTDHFSIYTFKDEVIFLKTVDDREVIRHHALGRFADLLYASAHSPAMLRYLDNTLNLPNHPNENYAREIMELHTLGVSGGYSEQDVKEVARCFTGWTVNSRGTFEFRTEWHDSAEKTVLGQTIAAGGGQADGEQVLIILANHPETASFICTKLVRRFVADNPPAAVVSACVQTWQQTNGDMRAIMRTLLNHPDFENAPPKFKRPFELVASFLRATNALYDGNTHMIEVLARLGQRPFAWPRPDGFPDTAIKWQGNLLDRWNFCLDAVGNRLPGVQIDWADLAVRSHGKTEADLLTTLRFFGRLFLGRDLDPGEETALMKGAAVLPADGRSPITNSLTVLIAGPAFQLR